MTNKEQTDKAKELLNDLTRLLDSCEQTLRKWAVDSVSGGYSTHQITPQLDLSNRIAATLYRVNRIRNNLDLL